jgi:hypothetical protein
MAAAAVTTETPGTSSVDAKTGTIVLPSSAAGHRIFVDGKVLPPLGSKALRLGCGTHTVQVGTAGRPRSVDVPCAGTVDLGA